MDGYVENKTLADYLVFAQPTTENSCVFCGSNADTFEFKEKIVCEDCIGFVKDFY